MITVLVAAANLFAQTFGGSWTCHATMTATSDHPARSFTTPLSVESAPGNKWTILRWGSQDGSGGGIAYVGFVPSENNWAYQDFHYDGTYGISTSAGPDKDGVWTWAGGGYYTPNGVTHGTMKWKADSPSKIERTYFRDDAGTLQPSGSDYCTRGS
jgi:hypothetical protein